MCMHVSANQNIHSSTTMTWQAPTIYKALLKVLTRFLQLHICAVKLYWQARQLVEVYCYNVYCTVCQCVLLLF